MFDRNFRNSFTPRMGQDDSPFITSYDQGPSSSGDITGLYTSVDQGPPAESYPGMFTSVDQGPPAESYPGMYTSVDQGPSAEPVPGLVTQKDLQESLKTPSPSTDWGKLAQALVAGAAGSYAAHAKAQAAFDTARAKAGLPPMPLQTAATGGSGISPNVIFLVGGIAAAAIIAAIAAA
jgi:hypothetical protein